MGMEDDILSPTAATISKAWIRKCVESHVSCAKNARHSSLFCLDNTHEIIDLDDKALMPSRLLHIRDDAAAGQSYRVYLVPGESLCIDVPYVTLSHRWGSAGTCMTVRANVESFIKDGLSLETLPKTFCDAIHVTRTLGYRHIWIDSLCIIQDDELDWKSEARRMAIIYDKAILNIAAMDGISSMSGLYPGTESSAGVLNTRGWACQERMISPRSLVFTQHAIAWECRECEATEEHPEMVTRPFSVGTDAVPHHLKDIFVFFRDWRLPPKGKRNGDAVPADHPDGNVEGQENSSLAQDDLLNAEDSMIRWDEEKNCVTVAYDSEKLPGHTQHMKDHIPQNGSRHYDEPSRVYPEEDDGTEPFGRWTKIVTERSHPAADYYPFLKVWWKFVSLYTQRELSYDSDKFLAINGITSITQRWTHMRNTFGLWFHFLDGELCWFVDRSTAEASRPETWLGPSWSWVSTRGGCVRNDVFGKLFRNGWLQIQSEIRTPVATSFDMSLPLEAWMKEKYHSIDLRGNLREAKVVASMTGGYGSNSCVLILSAKRRFSESEKVDFRPDCASDFHGASSMEVYCLHMWHIDGEDTDSTSCKDLYLVLKQTAAGEKNIPLERKISPADDDESYFRRRMRRVGYLEVSYERSSKRATDEIDQDSWWWWIQLV